MAASEMAVRGCLPFWGSWGTLWPVRMPPAAPWGGQGPGNLVLGVDKRPERVHAGLAVFPWARRPLGSVNCLRGRRRPHPGGLASCLWTVCVACAWMSECAFFCYGFVWLALIFSTLCNRGCSGPWCLWAFSLGVVGLREESEFQQVCYVGVVCLVWCVRYFMSFQRGCGRVFGCLLLVLNFVLVCKICLSSSSSLWNSLLLAWVCS